MAVAVCSRCAHFRMRAKPALFKSSELQTSAVLKAQLEWDQEDEERKRLEQQRFEAGQPFTYEPHSFPWCQAATPYDERLTDRLRKGAADTAEAARTFATENRALLERARKGDDAALTELGDRASIVVNPVSGEISQVYTLCDRLNTMGACPLYEAAKPS
jgi:hypothetical protein